MHRRENIVFEFIYQSGWGAFSILLLFQLPFMFFFLYVVFSRSSTGSTTIDISDGKVNKLKNAWISVVVILFLGINLFSIQYIPAISTAAIAKVTGDVVDVDVSAVSWNYEISKQEFTAGQSVRFSAKSVDTVHGFAVYHPDGRILFTLMLVPGVGPSSLIHTFTDPGTYKVRCLEYCGAAHHEMSDELIVTAKSS